MMYFSTEELEELSTLLLRDDSKKEIIDELLTKVLHELSKRYSESADN